MNYLEIFELLSSSMDYQILSENLTDFTDDLSNRKKPSKFKGGAS